jgi:signal transduction histidine kinase
MFRIVPECLTNVFRRSQSATAEIKIRHDDTSVSLEVQDHGRGITNQKLAALMRAVRELAFAECATAWASSTVR